MADASDRLRYVLDGLSFPVDRWELVPRTEHYGADATTLNELRALIDLGIGLRHSDAPATAYATELKPAGNTAASSPARWRTARTGSRSHASPGPRASRRAPTSALKPSQLRRPSTRRDLRPYRQSPGRR